MAWGFAQTGHWESGPGSPGAEDQEDPMWHGMGPFPQLGGKGSPRNLIGADSAGPVLNVLGIFAPPGW